MSGKAKRARDNELVYLRRDDGKYVKSIAHGEPPKPHMSDTPTRWHRWEVVWFLKWIGEAEAARYEIH